MRKSKKTLQSEFLAFHKENPEIYEEFKRVAKALILRGQKFYSADAIMHIIRFNLVMRTNGVPYKINNNHVAFYARLWRSEHEKYKNFFRIRGEK